MSLDTPPATILFDFQSHSETDNDITDIEALAKRRLRTVTANANVAAAPAPNVQFSFEGLADVVKAFRGDPPPIPVALPPLHDAPAPYAPHLPPGMILPLFCTQYHLAASTVEKLQGMELAGPHILRLLKDEHLVSDGHLTRAQVAEVRDAEERWLRDMERPA